MKKDLHAFQQFGIGSSQESQEDNYRAVLYTRVSTTEQEDNTSLEHQYRTCHRFADREGLQVIAEFGGKGESAKAGSARKEYERMMKFVKRKANKVRFIVFYDYSRFSREGGKAIVTKDQLRSAGIYIKSATMPIDTSNPFGSAMEDMQILYAKMENDVRRKRCVDGTIAKLRQGKWCGTAPTGYKWENGKIIQDTAKAPLVRMAFNWKLKNPTMTSEQIRARLRKKGLPLGKNTMSKIFKNPFYCGLLAHNLLQGEVVPGNHEPIVSKRTFLAVNNIMNERNNHGWQVAQEPEELPLKGYVRCAKCGTPMTGYITKSKNGKPRKTPIAYYKCRIDGCRKNVNAKHLGEVFVRELMKYQVKPELMPLIEQEIRAELGIKQDKRITELKRLKGSAKELDRKLKRLKERYVLEEEITRSDYEEFTKVLITQRHEIQQEINRYAKPSSDTPGRVEYVLNKASQIAQEWENGDFQARQRLQRIVFPDGVNYNKTEDRVRTPRINEILLISAYIQAGMPEKGKGPKDKTILQSLCVHQEGFEPSTSSSVVRCSIQLSYWCKRMAKIIN